MKAMNFNHEQTSFAIPLSITAHEIADSQRKKISNPESAKKIYLNALAVYAVRYYLESMGFEASYSDAEKEAVESNPWMLNFIDLADLEVKNIGKIECRPVLPDAEYLEIPTEVRTDRVAYVAVQFNESLREARILGFTTQVFITPELARVHINQLQSVDNFLDYLTTKETETLKELEAKKEREKAGARVNLREWMKEVFTEGWQSVEEIFSQRDLSLRFARNFSVMRCKKIDIGFDLNGASIALVIKLANSLDKDKSDNKSENRAEIKIVVQVHPSPGTGNYLPAGLKLVVVDEKGVEVDSVISRHNSNLIEIPLTAELDEIFQVEMILGESKVVQEFAV